MAFNDNIRHSNRDYKCLIHLDRLSITFKHWSGSTFQDIRNPDNISPEQVFGDITLFYDNSPGLGAFYHSYKVLYKGLVVGKLHSATKLKKHELQFDFAKEVFYSFYPGFWYEVYIAIKRELRILYNNIMYMEISVDTDKDLVGSFGNYYKNVTNNQLGVSKRFKLRKNTMVHVMNNGTSFVVAGNDNEIAIYNKSRHAEDYIVDYLNSNGLSESEIFRIETRLSWNYIRHLRTNKGLDIILESLTDQKKLAEIFKLSTCNKITFLDMTNKTYDENRNAHYSKINIIDDLPLETAEIGKLNIAFRNNHYKSENIDENIVRQIYYRYLETGNIQYLQNFKSSCSVAGFTENQIKNYVIKFNHRYNGNRIDEINQRMQYALSQSWHLQQVNLKDRLINMAHKLKSIVFGLI